MKKFSTSFTKSETCAAFALLAILMFVFWPEANKEFLFWDDEAFLSKFKPFLPVAWSSIVEVARATSEREYMPATKAVWMLIILPMQWLFGSRWSSENWVQPFVLVGILFHFLNCLLIKEIFSVLFKKSSSDKNWKDWIPVYVYALHPLQVEGLAAISMLRETLWVFFGLLTVRSYLRDHLKNSFFLFFVACLAKPTAVVIFGIIFILQLVKNGLESFKTKRILIFFSGLFGVATLIGFLAKSIQSSQDLVTSQLDRIYYSTDAFGFYVIKILLPSKLSLDYGRTYNWLSEKGWTIEMTAFVVFILLLIVLHWKLVEFRKEIVLLAAIFLLPLIPVSGLLPHSMQNYSNVADHYATFSLIAWSGLLFLIIRSFRKMYLLLIPVCFLYGLQSLQQKHVWINNETLSTKILEINPHSFMAYNNLGLHRLRLGNEKSALEDFEKALELNPLFVNAYLNTYYILDSHELFGEAVALLNKGKKNIPQNVNLRLSLGSALEKQNKVNEAIEIYKEAAQDFPENAKVRFKLGLAYLKQSQFAQAIVEFKNASERDTENQKYKDLLKTSEDMYEASKK